MANYKRKWEASTLKCPVDEYKVQNNPSTNYNTSIHTQFDASNLWTFHTPLKNLTLLPNSLFQQHPIHFLSKFFQNSHPFWYFQLFYELGFHKNLIFFSYAFCEVMNFKSLDDFWTFYVNQHSKPSTRRWHFVGTLFSILFLLSSVIFSWWFLFFVPLSGYGCAWYSHFFVEGNVPATFGHPFWSLLCDFKMFGLMLTGQMDREIKRLGKRPVLQVFWFPC